MTTTIDVAALEPLSRSEAIDLGLVEYGRLVDALRSLEPDQWAAPTDCTLWTVRDLAGHVAGMMWSTARIRRFAGEQVQAMRRAKAEHLDSVDAMTAIQVARMADLSTAELLDRMTELASGAAAGRRRMPGPLAKGIKAPQEVNGETEMWSLDYLFGTILTRDTWLHRVADLARAVDRAPQLDAAHDGRLVADVVLEWTRRHGQPVDLVLTGPAGGRYRHGDGDGDGDGDGGPQLELDAVEFCRILSGRADASHRLLETAVPF